MKRMDRKMKKLEEYVRSIPDFPEEGIIFRDGRPAACGGYDAGESKRPGI